ncbi:MAG TPA: S4 domain-containing protein [Steroidobacteraceae bacterium]
MPRKSTERSRSTQRSEPADPPERLQKALSRAGLASRREVEDWIRAGRITVNGEPAVLGVRVGSRDQVRLDGRLIRQRSAGGTQRVFICHRSPGELLRNPLEADASERSNTALIDRLPRRAGRRFIPISPMPRGDGGLELVTSDGELAAKLQRATRRLVSGFSVRVHGALADTALTRILQGQLDSGATLAVQRCEAAGGEGSNRWYAVSARGASGKDIRQLFERHGALVSRVLRVQLGSLVLDRDLSRGRFRELQTSEVQVLLVAS